MKTVAITGLLSPLGRDLGRLASQFGLRVLGIDMKPLTKPFPGVEFVEADLRNPLIGELFKAERVETIVHCAFRWRRHHTDEVFDSNVMGTMRMLGAAALAGVRKVILPSTTLIYGAHPENPAFIAEENDFRGRPAYAYVREWREIETFVSGFRRQHPAMTITVLRFAHILGGEPVYPLARWLSLPTAPILLGFEPMFQVIHYDDVLRAIGHAILEDHNGTYNIAADPPLPLLKLLALARVPPLPLLHPLAYRLGGGRLPYRASELTPLPWDYLRYGCVGDTTRMREELGFMPTVDAETTVRRFAEALHEHRYKTNQAYRLMLDGLRAGREITRHGLETAREFARRSEAAIASLRRASTAAEEAAG